MRLALLLTLAAWPVAADPTGTPLSGAEFEAYALGKTLTYSDGGTIWGQEQYLPGHRVIWAFNGADCQFGTWDERPGPDGPMVCFTYDDAPGDVNCWQFFRGARGLVAQFIGGDAALSELEQTDAPMQCQGPEVGA